MRLEGQTKDDECEESGASFAADADGARRHLGFTFDLTSLMSHKTLDSTGSLTFSAVTSTDNQAHLMMNILLSFLQDDNQD